MTNRKSAIAQTIILTVASILFVAIPIALAAVGRLTR
jgi:hypothetical protein